MNIDTCNCCSRTPTHWVVGLDGVYCLSHALEMAGTSEHPLQVLGV